MKNRSIWAGLFLLSFVFTGNAFAQSRRRDFTLDYEPGPIAANQNDALNPYFPTPLTTSWETFIAGISGSNAVTFGIDLMGALAYQKNASNPMVPASVQKLITTASAFKNLGATATFANYFEAQYSDDTASQIKFTVSGDPTWGHPEYETFDARMNQVMAELKAKGITQVTGDVEIVATRPELDLVARQSGWPARWDLECMATMPSSFMMNGNCGVFRVLSLTRAEWTTPGVDLPIHLNLTAGSANELAITPERDANNRTTGYSVSGKFKSETGSYSVPVYFGTRWLKNIFIASLASHGISYAETGDIVSGNSMMVDLSSIPLRDILEKGVQESINGILDRTFYEIAYTENLTNPTDASYGVLQEVIGDDSYLTNVEIYDGCGLNVNDRMRPDTLYQFLSKLQNESYFPQFLSVLAIAGESGTLKNRLTGSLTNKKVFGKTGTIDQYYNLVGYFQTPSQTLEPFTIFTSSNDSAATVVNMIDKMVTQFARLNTP